MPKNADSYLKKARTNRVIVLEELDFNWDRHELKTVSVMWDEGTGVEQIAEHFNRDPDEVLLALIHLAREEKISARNRGLKGENKQ